MRERLCLQRYRRGAFVYTYARISLSTCREYKPRPRYTKTASLLHFACAMDGARAPESERERARERDEPDVFSNKGPVDEFFKKDSHVVLFHVVEIEIKGVLPYIQSQHWTPAGATRRKNKRKKERKKRKTLHVYFCTSRACPAINTRVLTPKLSKPPPQPPLDLTAYIRLQVD